MRPYGSTTRADGAIAAELNQPSSPDSGLGSSESSSSAQALLTNSAHYASTDCNVKRLAEVALISERRNMTRSALVAAKALHALILNIVHWILCSSFAVSVARSDFSLLCGKCILHA